MIPHSAPPAATSAFESQLASYLDLVTPVIRAAVPDRQPKRHLYDLVSHQLARKGKGLRPALCIATCRAFDGDAARAVPSAAAVELLHNAFLVHDDIEDSSEYRRDGPTLHRQCGLPLAVNAGDAMNAMSLRVLKQNFALLGPALAARLFDEFDHMSQETIEGQAMELGWIQDNDCDTTEEDYLLMVLKKTCWYSFIHPCRMGALIAEKDGGHLDSFNRFGYYLGAAFQIQDDILNLVGERRTYGKEIGGDLYEGKRTLILTHLFRQSSPPDRQRLQAFLAKPRAQRLPRDVAWVVELIGAHGSIDFARQAAEGFAAAARREFDVAYGGATAGPDTDFVRALPDFAVSRTV
ncbi:MAG: polyprenyl synthetase family protein [Polyangiaceae bacterium]|jgi:geranylgeranyl diphosphate synthase type II